VRVCVCVCACVCVQLALYRTDVCPRNVHCSNLTGCHGYIINDSGRAFGHVGYRGSSYVGQACVGCPTVYIREVPYRHFKINWLMATLENACAYCLRPRVRVIRQA